MLIKLIEKITEKGDIIKRKWESNNGRREYK